MTGNDDVVQPASNCRLGYSVVRHSSINPEVSLLLLHTSELSSDCFLTFRLLLLPSFLSLHRVPEQSVGRKCFDPRKQITEHYYMMPPGFKKYYGLQLLNISGIWTCSVLLRFSRSNHCLPAFRSKSPCLFFVVFSPFSSGRNFALNCSVLRSSSAGRHAPYPYRARGRLITTSRTASRNLASSTDLSTLYLLGREGGRRNAKSKRRSEEREIDTVLSGYSDDTL